MPIRFRCAYCNRLLGIATRKAGMETTCPHCGYTITVPIPQEEDSHTERMNLDDVDQMLGNTATTVAQESGVVAPAVPSPPPAIPREEPIRSEPAPPTAKPRLAPPPVPKSPPKPTNPNERPLFEGDVDDILGSTVVPVEPTRVKPPATSGADAMSLGEVPRNIIISGGMATMLVALVVILMALAFAAGYFLAPRG